MAQPTSKLKVGQATVASSFFVRSSWSLSCLLLGNDSWEFFEGIPKHFTVRARVRMKLKFSSIGVVWELFQTAFAVLVSALYVMQTYQPALNADAFEQSALVVFSVDYLLNLYCCDNRYASLRYSIYHSMVTDRCTTGRSSC